MHNRRLKLVFAGTPAIAKTILEDILHNGFKVDLVLTQPDRPANRGKKLTMSQVKELALAQDITVMQPESFKNNPLALSAIAELAPDLIIVVAYGLILPKELLAIPKLGCINVHVSLLPRHRGAAPIQRAILAGDKETGVTLMQMDIGLDTGDILLQEKVTIDSHETAGTLTDKLAAIGSKLTINYLTNYREIKSRQQDINGVTYAHKIDKAEAQINWSDDAATIERKIRGFNPSPGCFSYLEDKLIKIWAAQIGSTSKSNATPGEIVAVNNDSLGISCGNESMLLVTELQEAGKNRQVAKVYLQSRHGLLGKILVSRE